MAHGCKCIFVGWERPLLWSVRDHLITSATAADAPPSRVPGVLDLSAFTVVLPGARAGRRLLELLVLGSAPNSPPASLFDAPLPAASGVVLPPRILTVGAWTRSAIAADPHSATPMARAIAWAAALADLSPDEQRAIFPRAHIQSTTSAAPWLPMARIIDACAAELAAEGLSLADVASSNDLPETAVDRWTVLASLRDRYLGHLATAGLVDDQVLLRDAVRAGRIDSTSLGARGRIVLAGVSELTGVARSLVDAIAEHAEALVFAPPSIATRFDAYGCVIASEWASATIPVPSERIIVEDSPTDQATAALAEVARICGSAGRAVPPDQFSIGVPDDEVTPRMVRLASRLEGTPVRVAAGSTVASTRPMKLLLAIARYVDRRDFNSLASLVRHPDVERVVHGRAVEAQMPRVDWPSFLDAYYAEHLHDTVSGVWLGTDKDQHELLSWLTERIQELLTSTDPAAGRVSLFDAAPRSLLSWAPAIRSMLRAVYPTPIDHDTDAALAAIESKIADFMLLPAMLADRVPTTSAEALRTVIGDAGVEPIAAPAEGPAIELLGWLELSHDDAPNMIITGMNEGRVPAPTTVDALLPEPTRRSLGLVDRTRRYARDALSLSAIMASRPATPPLIILGRRSSGNDPLAPSRLLFACPESDVVQRVLRWTGESAEPGAAPPATADIPAAVRPSIAIPGRSPGVTPRIVSRMSVTSFRDYIASPYGFFLKHVLKLRELDDAPVELDALGFGTLVHEVLRKLSAADEATSTDASRIEAFLVSNLQAVASLAYGDDPRPEVWLQVQHARARLRAFAVKQAERAREGWRVLHTEWSPSTKPASLELSESEGGPMQLTGRIDRIDVRDDGAWAVLDYKTAADPPTMSMARSRNGWRDVQLPLYRHLARSLGLSGDPQLGWIALPAETTRTAFVIATWKADELELADETARDVVRRVRRNEFDDLGDAPPDDGVLGALCRIGRTRVDGDKRPEASL